MTSMDMEALYECVEHVLQNVLETKLPELAAKLRPHLKKTFQAEPVFTTQIHFPCGGMMATTMTSQRSMCSDKLLDNLRIKVHKLEKLMQSCKSSQHNLEKAFQGDSKRKQTTKKKKTSKVRELTSNNLLLHNALIHNESSCPPWASSFFNVQQHLEDRYGRWGLEKIETDDELLVRVLDNVLNGDFPLNSMHDMQDLIIWKMFIKTGSVINADLSNALIAFMTKHDMDISKAAKINVASFKLKSWLLYGDKFHRQCWASCSSQRQPKKKETGRASTSPWKPMDYAPEEVKSMPDFEHTSYEWHVTNMRGFVHIEALAPGCASATGVRWPICTEKVHSSTV